MVRYLDGAQAPDGEIDVIVVGNGVLGLSLALSLSRRDYRVVIVGERSRPYAASVAAGAMLGCFGEVGPYTLLSAYGRAKLELDYKASKAWPQWLATASNEAGLDDEQVWLAAGTVIINNTIGQPEIDDASWFRIREALDQYGEPYEDMQPSDVPWLNPEPIARPLKAMLLPSEHAIDPVVMLEILEGAAERRGIPLIDGTVTSLVASGDVVNGVCLSSGVTLHAADTVVAAGSRTQAILDSVPNLTRRIPRLVSAPGIAAIVEQGEHTPSLPYVVRTPNRAFACGLHAVPRRDGAVYLGATNAVRPNPTRAPSVRGLQFLLDCAVRQLRRELWLSDIREIRVGNRPASLDGFPVIGPSDGDGLWILSGTYRDGLHMSPVLAESFATWFESRVPPEDLILFTPVRKPIQALDRVETIREAVTHRLATGHEFAWSLPVDWPMNLEELYHSYYRDLADTFTGQFTPPPDILSFIPRYPALRQVVEAYYREWSG